jgi:hypothetical protein
MNDRTISIFEEYCNSVETLPGGDSVEVKINGKYFTELYTRVMLHGWACISIMSDESNNHIATFVENGALGLFENLMGDDFDMNEMFGDDFKDDESDWWKKSE